MNTRQPAFARASSIKVFLIIVVSTAYIRLLFRLYKQQLGKSGPERYRDPYSLHHGFTYAHFCQFSLHSSYVHYVCTFSHTHYVLRFGNVVGVRVGTRVRTYVYTRTN